MLVPHGRENAEFGDRRLAAHERKNALIFFGREAPCAATSAGLIFARLEVFARRLAFRAAGCLLTRADDFRNVFAMVLNVIAGSSARLRASCARYARQQTTERFHSIMRR